MNFTTGVVGLVPTSSVVVVVIEVTNFSNFQGTKFVLTKAI